MPTEKWEYQHIDLDPTESHYDCLRANGKNGWEAWHMERNDRGWKTLYFKRRVS